MTKKKMLEIDTDYLRQNLLKYTRKAFQMLPEIEKPNILDIGCGSGAVTVEIASLSNGRVTGLDIDQIQLNKLEQKIREADLTDRVYIVKCSMDEMCFQEDSFDIIWAEGSISAIGFKKGLLKFRRFLKRGGFLVVHDDLRGLNKKIGQISDCGYKLLSYFTLNKDVWWKEYYMPLEKQIEEIRIKYASGTVEFSEVNKLQKEIEGFEKDPESYQSVFFIMQKT